MSSPEIPGCSQPFRRGPNQMAFVHIESKFTLLRENGSTEDFFPGQQHIADEDAGHWYVKLHLKGHTNTMRLNTWEYVQEQQREKMRAMKEAEDEQLALAQAEVERRRQMTKQAVENATKHIVHNAKVAVKRERLLQQTR